jgi:SAM-dependent methyltransferase
MSYRRLSGVFLGGLPGGKMWRDWFAQRKASTRFREEFEAFKRLSNASEIARQFNLRWEDRHPCPEDRTATTSFDRHYVYHTAWGARIVAQTHPAEHVDIASSLFFAGIVSAFVPVRFYDYRPADLKLDNLASGAADLLSLPFPDGSIGSLSCMHVVEHIGLGRYGDRLDPDGDRKGMQELKRVLAPGGFLLFVVPVGRPRICFNAHRIYSLCQVREAFGDLELKQSALVPDDPASEGLIVDPPATVVDSQTYGCGCFWFRKPAIS